MASHSFHFEGIPSSALRSCPFHWAVDARTFEVATGYRPSLPENQTPIRADLFALYPHQVMPMHWEEKPQHITVRVTDDSAETDRPMGAEEGSSHIRAYMCEVDYSCELGMGQGCRVVACSIEDLRERRKCVDGCGIVEVKVEKVRDVTLTSLDWLDTEISREETIEEMMNE